MPSRWYHIECSSGIIIKYNIYDITMYEDTKDVTTFTKQRITVNRGNQTALDSCLVQYGQNIR
jgi:hypothetical protein